MKLIAYFLLFSGTLFGQQNADDFDFWVGEWNLHWYDQDSNLITGENSITKDLGGSVIREMFRSEATKTNGASLSVLSALDSTWHQTWVDNQGSYIPLDGITKGDQRIFQTKPYEQNGNTFISRMRFYNISVNSFTWDWEKSADNGESWQLSWRIHYNRRVE